MSVLRITRLAVTGIFASALMLAVAPSALAQYGGGPSGSGGSVTVGSAFTATFPAGSGFLPNEILDGLLQPTGNVSGASYAPAPSSTVKSLGTATLSVRPAAFTPRAAQTVTAKGRANADGSVALTFRTAGLPVGSYTGTVTGQTSHHSGPFSLSIVPAGSPVGGVDTGAGSTATSGTGSGPLAFTGANGVTPLAIGGLALIGVGAAAVVFTRRRKVDA